MAKEVAVLKTELLAVLEGNRERHHKVYQDALEGFARHRRAALEGELARMKQSRKPKELRLFLDKPEDHTKDYDRVIIMVKMSVGDTFTLSEQDFARYVMDDWEWKARWLKMSSIYAAESVTSNYAEFDDDDS